MKEANIFPASGIEYALKSEFERKKAFYKMKMNNTTVVKRYETFHALLKGIELNELQLKLYRNEETSD